jgi:two-component system OmpR family sensor kinase
MALTFKTRLALWHMAVVAVILAVAAAGAQWALSRAVLRTIIDDSILALAESEAAALLADPTAAPARIHEMAPGTAPPSFIRLDKFIQIVDLDGRVVARGATLGTARLPTPPGLLSRLRAGEVVFDTRYDFGEEPIRVVSLPLPAGAPRYAVQVAMSLDDAYAVLRTARWLFLGLSLAILAGTGLTGAVLARRALRPIDQIVTTARRLGEGDLAERLPHPGTRDEVGRLVATLNDMLARIEQGVEAQRRFTADASHELRSPLTRLRAELEVTLRRPRERSEYEEALRSGLDEVERLSRLTDELLVLARLDAGEGREPSGPAVPLVPILDDALRRLAPEADRRGVSVALDPAPPIAVRAAPSALGLVVTNLLDNALKDSPPGSRVRIGVAAAGDEAVLSISDTGPGIPPEELPQLFQRFHRGHAARATEAPGVGLGLAICQALVERHGGRIAVESPPAGGATFRVHLPLAN